MKILYIALSLLTLFISCRDKNLNTSTSMKMEIETQKLPEPAIDLLSYKDPLLLYTEDLRPVIKLSFTRSLNSSLRIANANGRQLKTILPDTNATVENHAMIQDSVFDTLNCALSSPFYYKYFLFVSAKGKTYLHRIENTFAPYCDIHVKNKYRSDKNNENTFVGSKLIITGELNIPIKIVRSVIINGRSAKLNSGRDLFECTFSISDFEEHEFLA
ncbi:MAG TPA: hypothetical protein VKS81_00560, partial [Bacteroidota bacterium]|nr:hypothetical protein [Bacteroidota bacterium]